MSSFVDKGTRSRSGHESDSSQPSVGKRSLVERRYGGVQLKRSSPGGGASPNDTFAVATSGVAQEVPYRAEMEQAFGIDLANVKAYVGDVPARQGLGELHARGAAQGSQVAFNTASPSKELVAHELTHVVQASDGVHASSEVSTPSDPAEREADAVAARVAAGEPAGPICETAVGIHLDPEPGSQSDQSASDAVRSVGDHAARTALHEAALREMYFSGERAIAAEATRMRASGQTEEAVARWAVEARNQLRRAIREQGEPIVDAVARASRGARDMPNYESLRAAGRSDAQIIESAARSNTGVNRWVGRLRIAGRIVIAVDVGIAAYNVASAPDVDRPRVMAQEAGRLGGALAGGAAGAAGGAKVGGAIGTFFGPGLGTAIGAGVGGVLGGIGGAIFGGEAGEAIADWAIDEFYPPANTHFEPQ